MFRRTTLQNSRVSHCGAAMKDLSALPTPNFAELRRPAPLCVDVCAGWDGPAPLVFTPTPRDTSLLAGVSKSVRWPADRHPRIRELNMRHAHSRQPTNRS